jgi:hypothetical protein
MKKILLIAIVFATSCNSNVSEKDKEYINSQITLHNTSVGLDYKMRNAGNPSVESDTNMIKSGVNYEPNFDPNLTYERFINYCTKEKLNPLDVAKKLSIKK